MFIENNRVGYDPDQYDDEPSDYVNSDTNPMNLEDNDGLDEEDDLWDDGNQDDDEPDDTDVTGDDAVNDDVTDYAETEPAARNTAKKPVYIKDMPYIDHATPGVTSH